MRSLFVQINFGSAERSKAFDPDTDFVVECRKKSYHADNDWYRHFLDSSSTALTIVYCFTDIPKWGGGTVLCEDGLKGEPLRLSDGYLALLAVAEQRQASVSVCSITHKDLTRSSTQPIISATQHQHAATLQLSKPKPETSTYFMVFCRTHILTITFTMPA